MRSSHKSVFIVEGMCCADEQRIIEKRLREAEGVESYSFNLVARKLYVTHRLDESAIPGIIKSAGFDACPVSSAAASSPGAARAAEGVKEKESLASKISAHRDTAAALVCTALGILLDAEGAPVLVVRGVLGLGIVWGGWKIAKKAWAALKTFTFEMNVLMTAAVIGAVAIGKWSEGAAVIALFALSQVLEELSMARTRRAISSLLESAPPTAAVIREGVEETVALARVVPGDRVKVRPGEKIPVDGSVTAGHSTVNESTITGEALPALKTPGSHVFAGTMNERGTLEIRVEQTGDSTTLARIIHLVEQAQAQRAPAQRFIERFAAVYSPSVLVLAVLVAALPPLMFHAEFGLWFYRSLVLLVIACPCALVISTPVTVISGLAAAARSGILIKGGRFLEEAASVRALAFDKTGTLTYGLPSVTDILPANGLPPEELVRLAALGEQHSEHVLADAVMRKAEEMQCRVEEDATAFEAVPGKGISMRLESGKYFVGSFSYIEEQGVDITPMQSERERLEREGKTVIAVAGERGLLGAIAVADVIREESREALSSFAREGIEHTVLLSGDNQRVTERVAASLGIKEARGGLLPHQKVDAVNGLRERYTHVAMIGDGINDAPALASATLGIAIGNGGTDAAMETSDIVLLKNDLRALTTLLRLSRRTMRILKQNIAIALLAKAAFLLLALAGMATLWMAVVADDGVTLLVVFNSFRLLKRQKAVRNEQ